MSVAKCPGVKRGAQSRLVPGAPRPVLRGCFAPGVLFDAHDAAGCWLRTQDSKNTIRTYMCKKWGRPPAKHVSIVAPLFPLTIPRTLNPKCYKAFCRGNPLPHFAVTDFELGNLLLLFGLTDFVTDFGMGNPLPQKCGNGFWVIRYRIFAVTDLGMCFFLKGNPLPQFCGNGFWDG
ncbi:hypothetical protein B0H14DRAFT_2654538 [Mycena olivaceomarginata]|nr:hypothetical protein B0H14DRAFT_2654538 [Mycena olivaceomarginata]